MFLYISNRQTAQKLFLFQYYLLYSYLSYGGCQESLKTTSSPLLISSAPGQLLSSRKRGSKAHSCSHFDIAQRRGSFGLRLQSSSSTKQVPLFNMPRCSACGRTKFADSSGLLAHQKATGHCYCKQCNRGFVDNNALRQHRIKIHAKRCQACQLGFLDDVALHKHRFSFHGINAYCQICAREFIDEEALSQHRAALHGQRNYHRQASERKFVDEESLKQHQITVHEKKPCCEACQREFVDDEALTQHRTALHEPAHCQECNLSFHIGEDLRKHSAISHGNKCNTCSSGFASVPLLQDHQRSSNHCFCRQCNRLFTTASHLDRHLRFAPAHSMQYHCCDCDRDFVDEQALSQHLQFKIHPAKVDSSKSNKYPCTKCDRKFKTKPALNQHLSSLVHNPLSDIKCVASSDCAARFTSPSAMILHLESGNCSSRMTRERLNFLIQSNDHERVISKGPEDLLTAAPSNFDSRSGPRSDSESNPDAGFADMQNNNVERTLVKRPENLYLTSYGYSDSDSDSDSDDGVPIYTPLSVDTRSQIAAHSAEDLWTHLLSKCATAGSSPPSNLTPGSSFDLTEPNTVAALFCPLCPADRKAFHSIEALQMHLASPKHAPKAFHCPTILVSTTKRGNDSRRFKTLSGLTQHLESGACKGGKAGLRKTIQVLEARLSEMGLKHQGLLRLQSPGELDS